MQRVLIIGSGGAGKSWLARRLAEATGLPLVHLDREYWRPGWVEPPKDAWRARVAELIASERWILDGNYGGTLPARMERADTIVFLDVSRWHALLGIARRWWRYRGTPRPDVTDGCPERMTWTFVRWVWRYTERTRPLILEMLGDHAHGRAIVVLRDRGEIAAFLQRS